MTVDLDRPKCVYGEAIEKYQKSVPTRRIEKKLASNVYFSQSKLELYTMALITIIIPECGS